MPADADKRQGRPPPATLVVGPGARTWTEGEIRRLLCPRTCGSCPTCRKLAHASHPDVRRLRTEGKNVKIDQVRDLQAAARFPPLEGPWKVFVIEEAGALSREAANALLKLLEDPPAYLRFFLLAEELNALLPTVISRCRLVRAPATGDDDPESARLCWGRASWRERFPLEAAAPAPPEPRPAALVAALAEAEGLQGLHAGTVALWRALSGWNAAEVLDAAAGLAKLPTERLAYVLTGLTHLARAAWDPPAGPALAALEAVCRSRGALAANANAQLLLESVLLRLWTVHGRACARPRPDATVNPIEEGR